MQADPSVRTSGPYGSAEALSGAMPEHAGKQLSRLERDRLLVYLFCCLSNSSSPDLLN
jgi:hypothetical protein